MVSKCLLTLFAATTVVAHAQPLRIFACEPEWAALVRVLAPDAEVSSATHVLQDPHHIEARPALIGQLRRADLAVCTGASLEAGWLPMLQQRAANPAVQMGKPGLFFAAEQVKLIGIPEQVDRSNGDVHAEGNPHLHLDPHRLQEVAAALAERLAHLDPTGAPAYRQRYLQWADRWQQRMAGWQSRAASLRGQPVVAQHSSFAYLWAWLGLRQSADLEPKPGLPPSPGHLQQVLSRVRSELPLAVVQTSYQNPQPGEWLARQTGRPLLALPATVMSEGPAATLDGWFTRLIDQLLSASTPS
ncbi:metal ABC transporter substrate-binding protein [Chitinimonas sp. BJB300]|uniref:metal ABC transporter substrate-binding protein n=1 Tax=Chitinimonas sp. BJB300 TaxID=1559339 RepID=UPI000C0D22B8|nr:zinc ABC transporter substrate-binding protein [Chitinimonas sp. BJB300]PHV13451.1 zinc ABC transporter substrate-binding protein [Chitinimonas sp. BJB300]TSJ89760.1 zinc ABC transporter substrate-binding protein [Chitinimonas sp. BJB300]